MAQFYNAMHKKLHRKQNSNKAETQWEKANISYQNYLAYINNKAEKFCLNYIDLLYVSNFKGGNASINENESVVNKKLYKYSQHLISLYQKFENKHLRYLTNEELDSLKESALSFIQLTLSNETSIDGFKCSYASALLHFYFPNLVPILDRRVLNGIGIKVKRNKQGQVVNIERYYSALIDLFHSYLKYNPNKSLRDYDKENFVKPLKDTETAGA